jgi:hypothetical protein
MRRPCRWCGRKWRWAAGLLAFLLLAHAAATIVTGRMVARRLQDIKRRGEPVSLKDLAGPPIPDAQNAAPLYLEALRRLPSPEELFQQRPNVRPPGTLLSQEELKQIGWYLCKQLGLRCRGQQLDVPIESVERTLSRVAPVLRLVELASARPGCQFQIQRESGRESRSLRFDPFPDLFRAHSLPVLLTTKALLDLHRGNRQQALNAITVLLRVGDHFGSAALGWDALIRNSFHVHALDVLRKALEIAPLARHECEQMQQRLNSIDQIGPFERAMQGERLRLIWYFDQLRREAPWFTVRLIAGRSPDALAWNDYETPPGLRHMIARLVMWAWAPFVNMDETFSLRLWQRQFLLARQPYRRAAAAFERLALGRERGRWAWYAVFTKMHQPLYGGMMLPRDFVMARIGLAQWALALQVYQIEHGSYPDSLYQARKRLRWRLPQDPFSGTDFIYRHEGRGYIIYSIGENLRDDKGLYRAGGCPPMPVWVNQKARPHCPDDIVWRMPG